MVAKKRRVHAPRCKQRVRNNSPEEPQVVGKAHYRIFRECGRHVPQRVRTGFAPNNELLEEREGHSVHNVQECKCGNS